MAARRKGTVRICLMILFLFLTGCLQFLDAKTIFGIAQGTIISVTLDKPAGRYNPLPTSVAVQFPVGVDMTTVTAANFTLTEACAASNPNIVSVSFAGQVATVNIANSAACINNEYYNVVVSFERIKVAVGKVGVGSATYTYTYDNSPPTVSVAVNTISGITTSSSFTFSSAPTTATFSFTSDIDMSLITIANFTVGTAAMLDCFTMPTVSSLSKNATTGTVTVNFTGAVCNNGESFRLTLGALTIPDSTKNGTNGLAAANYGPASTIAIDVKVDTAGVSVINVGVAPTTASGTYGISNQIDIYVTFDAPVDVIGQPRIVLNTTPTSRYAMYVSGTGTSQLLFRYLVQYGDAQIDLDYTSTSALQLNGGLITKTGTGGGITALLTLAAPAAPGSLGANRNIVIDTAVPTVTATSPTGTTNQWGQSIRTVTYTMSEQIAPASLTTADLAISAGTCATPPTVTAAYLTGVTSNVINFDISTTACTNGQVYSMAFNPANVMDLSLNPGYGTSKVLSVTVTTTVPTISVSAPNKLAINSTGTVSYTLTYSGASAVTLANTDLTLSGFSIGCAGVVSGTGLTSRTITISGCTGDGAVQMSIAANTAINTYGNFAAAVPNVSITTFNADNTQLPDPTTNLAIFNAVEIYNKDTLANFTLSFLGDSLGTSLAVQSALTLACNAGVSANAVAFTASRSSNTIVTVTPNEASPDFVYGATCSLNGVSVPDYAGNLHNFTAPLNFTVGRSVAPVSGPTGSVSLAAATAAGNLGNAVFNVPLDITTLNNLNVTLTCNGFDVALPTLVASVSNTTVLIDFDQFDPDWTALIGGETCNLNFSTSVMNSLSMPLISPIIFSFTTAP